MLMTMFALALIAGSTQLSTMAGFMNSPEVGLRVSLGLALFSLIMVALAENARIPVDNPATHLELTMVHEAMVLEYSGRHLALIELAASLKLLLYVSLIACLFAPWGLATPGGGPQALAIGDRRLRRQACRRRSAAGCIRDQHCEDASVPGSRISRGGADARPFGNPSPIRLAEPIDAQSGFRRRPHAGRLAGADELHAALSGPALRAPQHFRAPRAGAGALGRVAGLHPGRAASLCHRVNRACFQGDHHPVPAAPDGPAAGASTARSRMWSASERRCCSAWGSSPCPWW